MNDRLAQLSRELALEDQDQESLRLAFGLACADRVKHLLEDPKAIDCLEVLRSAVAGKALPSELQAAREVIARLANSHRGSNSIDGTSHAAVSATYSVAKALAGRALEAASYAAYATVYAYGGYAVTDPSAFEAEFDWQVEALDRMARSVRRAGVA